MLIVCLIKEHVFSIVSLRSVLFKDAFSANAVLLAQPLPKFVADWGKVLDEDMTYFGFRTGPLAV